ncbi:unnamed protein product [Hymenolepis diminuta]|uniref:Uncharacterized protein n=1 Tax=Hymenolepis diminuta TaxID=6216 RepID=A0A564Z958_HYMDI|nr:unnamed protein product [Hymenolepis diminuta]VUZ55960.1 unnamed protein product [Hymenolepis diminuta]
MSKQTDDHLRTTHRTVLMHWSKTCEWRRCVVEKEVKRHPRNTKSSCLMEATFGVMESISKDHLMKACSHFWTRVE